MTIWLSKESDFFIENYKDSKPVVDFLKNVFSDSTKFCTLSRILLNASTGYGCSTSNGLNAYMLKNDADGGDIVRDVEFFFNDEFDARVSIPTYVAGLDEVSNAYVEFYPEEKENILALMGRVKLYFRAKNYPV